MGFCSLQDQEQPVDAQEQKVSEISEISKDPAAARSSEIRYAVEPVKHVELVLCLWGGVFIPLRMKESLDLGIDMQPLSILVACVAMFHLAVTSAIVACNSIWSSRARHMRGVYLPKALSLMKLLMDGSFLIMEAVLPHQPSTPRTMGYGFVLTAIRHATLQVHNLLHLDRSDVHFARHVCVSGILKKIHRVLLQEDKARHFLYETNMV